MQGGWTIRGGLHNNASIDKCEIKIFTHHKSLRAAEDLAPAESTCVSRPSTGSWSIPSVDAINDRRGSYSRAAQKKRGRSGLPRTLDCAKMSREGVVEAGRKVDREADGNGGGQRRRR